MLNLSSNTSNKKILIVVPKAFLPQLTGGLEISANEIAQLCIQQGFDVHVAAGSLGGKVNRFFERVRRKMFKAYSNTKVLNNITIYNELWHPAGLSQLINKLKPQAILFFTSGTDDVTKKIIETNLPTAIFLYGVKMSPQLRTADSMKKCEFICESNFIAMEAKSQLGVNTRKIGPVLLKEKYAVDVTGQKILVVNPNPKKGGEIILRIAKSMPHRNFLVVGGWQHEIVNDENFDIESGLNLLENVERLPNVVDMRAIFEQSYCLLMPCVGREAYGRIAAEAQISGLPVIASSQGALVETVGEGGITIDYLSPIKTWVSILESLFCDPSLYAELSLLAKKESNKAERKTSHINEQLAKLIDDLMI
jgi:glycosyltransferase involved in cell wall biosynthesis